MKIYYFGTPEFAVPALEILAKNTDFKIQAVVTQPDKPGNRGKITPSPVKEVAQNLGLRVLQPRKIDKELIGTIKKDAPDAIVVVAYGGLIPKELLNIPKYGCINVHPSLLPKYRGASPIQEALLNGDTDTGIAIIQLDEELDHGDVFLIKRMAIEENENFESLSKRLSETTAVILPLALIDIANDTLPPIKQNHFKSTYCRKISKEEGLIDFNRKTQEILNQIRALNPWPSTYTKIRDKTLKILEATKGENLAKKNPGEIVIINKNSFGFQTKDGLLVPTKVQLEGKPPITTKEFMNGNKKLLEK